jgi:hypothetical protein
MGGYDQFSLAPYLHTLNALVPTFDDPARAQWKGKRLTTLK